MASLQVIGQRAAFDALVELVRNHLKNPTDKTRWEVGAWPWRLSGKEIFLLHDTYGLPVEMIEEQWKAWLDNRG